MKYYIIVGEASGDLHAAGLMRALRRHDAKADFRFFGGDLMIAEGGTCVKHYRDLAYMGFIPVLLHLRTIMRTMAFCRHDIVEYHPDAVILVDYPGFNLDIAKFLHAKTSIPVYYYISPKIWAWKEYRIKNIKRDITEMFSILPFEVPFYEGKHGYKVHYVGNPTANEVDAFLAVHTKPSDEATPQKSVIALLPGSRKQEIKDNLPAMLNASEPFADRYKVVIAGAPGIGREHYDKFIEGKGYAMVLFNQTYDILSQAAAAVVTSGTATLETALFGVPQVVCYKTPIPKVIAFLRRHLIKVKYISLVNLIADREIVPELVADTFSVENIRCELAVILPSGTAREAMLSGYADVRQRLGSSDAPDTAASIIVSKLSGKT